MLQISFEGSLYPVEKGTLLKDFLSARELKRTPLLVRLNGQMKDFSEILTEDVEVLLIYSEDKNALHVLRHSAAHLLAHAVTELFPGVQIGIGPDIENGFYYDFLKDEPFIPDDLTIIEDKMNALVQQNIPYPKNRPY